MNYSINNKLAIEGLLKAVFRDLLPLARAEGITVKRMNQLLTHAQLEALQEEGLNEREMEAISGYSRPSVRKILKESIRRDETNRVERFVNQWAMDPEFPRQLPLSGGYPSFQHLCDIYGGDSTATVLLRLLEERKIIRREEGCILLLESTISNRDGVDIHRAMHCLSHFVHNWVSDSDFPESLNISGELPSFEHLCKSYSTGIPPETMIKLLIEHGIVKRTKNIISLLKYFAIPVERFVNNWDADMEFPDRIPIDKTYPSFADLVDRYGVNCTAPTMLKILEDRGIIRVNQGIVTLKRNRRVIADSGVDMIKAATISLNALLSTLNHNLAGGKPLFTERRLWTHLTSGQKVAELREIIRDLNAAHEQRIIDAYAPFQALPDEKEKNLKTVGVGIYWFEQHD